jgi:hypothetical protein
MVLENGQWKVEHQTWRNRSSSSENQAPDRQWCYDASVSAFPRKPASGSIHGRPFTVKRAEFIGKHSLRLRQGAGFFPDLSIELLLQGEYPPTPSKILVDEGSGSEGPYLLPVWIVLRLPDKEKSYVEGYFEVPLKQ